MEHKGPPIFKAWLVFVVFATVLGFVAGAIAGLVVGFVLAATGYTDLDNIQLASGIAGFIAGLPVSFLVFQRVINRLIIPNVWPPSAGAS